MSSSGESTPVPERAERDEGPPPLKRNYLTPKLLAITLVLDACVILFAGLAAFGLKRLDPGVAFGGGAAAFVVCLLVAGLVMRRRSWAIWLGWLIQFALIASGLILSPMYLLGAGSLALWVWCLWRGGKADRAAPPSANPSPAGDAR